MLGFDRGRVLRSGLIAAGLLLSSSIAPPPKTGPVSSVCLFSRPKVRLKSGAGIHITCSLPLSLWDPMHPPLLVDVPPAIRCDVLTPPRYRHAAQRPGAASSRSRSRRRAYSWLGLDFDRSSRVPERLHAVPHQNMRSLRDPHIPLLVAMVVVMVMVMVSMLMRCLQSDVVPDSRLYLGGPKAAA